MSKKCPDCGSLNVEEVFDGEAYCKNCYLHCSAFDLEDATVFDKIKQSPEVMAKKFVYCNIQVKTIPGTSHKHPGGLDIIKEWYSTIIPDKVWSNEEDAFTATVEKLYEVENV